MRSRPALLAIVVILLLAVGGGAATWALFLRGDNVAPLSLPSRAPTSSSGSAAASPAAGASGATTSLPPASAAAVDAASMPGTWTIGADSVVGYRVRERLASLSADSDAVGRTSTITGTATIAASGGTLSVAAADFSVDMTTIKSDRQMRDNRLRNDGIQTDSFPTSTFKLTTPVALPAAATTGAQVSVTLHGDLTLHGVTKTVDIPAKAQLNGSLIQVVGSLDFPFSDFAINAPNIGGFVAVEDHGTLEFLVNLAKS
ncbi:MAG TPA: YceI family protein [Candidatus Limnocylindrales bacterium]|nr:YceI family protein [Candidatus Limnocylindrales bacterium]